VAQQEAAIRLGPRRVNAQRRYDVKKLIIAKKCLPLALALAGFVASGTVPVFAQSSGTWVAGISTRNARPFVHTPSILDSGYSSYAQAPATIHHLAPDYDASSDVWSTTGRGNIGH
jgi:hypothetical protein